MEKWGTLFHYGQKTRPRRRIKFLCKIPDLKCCARPCGRMEAGGVTRMLMPKDVPRVLVWVSRVSREAPVLVLASRCLLHLLNCYDGWFIPSFVMLASFCQGVVRCLLHSLDSFRDIGAFLLNRFVIASWIRVVYVTFASFFHFCFNPSTR